jgi:hypothetical protein
MWENEVPCPEFQVQCFKYQGVEEAEERLASIRKFEDLIAWQEARKLVKTVYRITSDGGYAKDYIMRDPIQCVTGYSQKSSPREFYRPRIELVT